MGWTPLGFVLAGVGGEYRRRSNACLEAGVKPLMGEYDGNNPFAFVLSSNLHRRHLNETQRAVIAAKRANIPHGGDMSKSPIGDAAVSQADGAPGQWFRRGVW